MRPSVVAAEDAWAFSLDKECIRIMRSVSTWSLHRTLGRYVSPESSVHGGPVMDGSSAPQGLALLDLPEALKRQRAEMSSCPCS